MAEWAGAHKNMTQVDDERFQCLDLRSPEDHRLRDRRQFLSRMEDTVKEHGRSPFPRKTWTIRRKAQQGKAYELVRLF